MPYHLNPNRKTCGFIYQLLLADGTEIVVNPHEEAPANAVVIAEAVYIPANKGWEGKMAYEVDDPAIHYRHKRVAQVWNHPDGHSALVAVMGKAGDEVAQWQAIISDPFKRLEHWVATRDWYHWMSDDFYVHQAGNEHDRYMNAAYTLAEAVDPQQAKDTWNRVCHRDFIKA